jgi:hypothetical protein
MSESATDIFISYAREDRELAHALASACESSGWHVWWDSKIIDGTAFDEVIARQLDVARVVVVLWTEESVRSSFVKDEAARAASAEKLLPARIGAVELPLGFGQIQTRDLGDWDGDADDPALQALLAQIRYRLEGKAPPELPKPGWWQRLRMAGVRKLWMTGLAVLVLAAGGWWYAARENQALAFELTLQGLQAQEEEHFERAIAYFSEAIRARRSYPPPWMHRGMLYATRGEVRLARSDLDEALKLRLDGSDRLRAEYLLALLAEEAPAATAGGEAGAGEAPSAAAEPPRPAAAAPVADAPAAVEAPAAVPPIAASAPAASAPTMRSITPRSARRSASAAAASIGAAASSVSSAVAAVVRPGPPPEPPLPTLPDTAWAAAVRDIFSGDAGRRLQGELRLATTPGWSAEAAPACIAYALARPKDSAAVLAVLRYLQGQPAAELYRSGADFARLLDVLQRTQPNSAATAAARRLTALMAAGRPRIYLHIGDEAQRPLARALARAFEARGLPSEGIDNVAGRARLPSGRSEVRVQGNSRPELAKDLAARIDSLQAGPVGLVPLPKVMPERDTYEVWFDADLCVSRKVAACAG